MQCPPAENYVDIAHPRLGAQCSPAALCGTCHFIYQEDIQPLSHVGLVNYCPLHYLSLSQGISDS